MSHASRPARYKGGGAENQGDIWPGLYQGVEGGEAVPRPKKV